MLKPNYIYQFFRYLKLLLALFILIIFSNIAYSDVYKVENLIIEKQHKNDKNFKYFLNEIMVILLRLFIHYRYSNLILNQINVRLPDI